MADNKNIKSKKSKRDTVRAKKEEPESTRMLDYMVMWDVSLIQMACIITEFNNMDPEEQKAFVDYSEAIIKIWRRKHEGKVTCMPCGFM
jgi:hypothetical protein